MTKPNFTNLIPDRTNFIDRYGGDDFIYAIYFPNLYQSGVIKVGLSRTNPWQRCRQVARAVAKKHGDRTLDGLQYVVMSGGWHDEQMIHGCLAETRYTERGVIGGTEFFMCDQRAMTWFRRRQAEVLEQAIEPTEIEVRTKRRRSKFKRNSSTKLYIPAE